MASARETLDTVRARVGPLVIGLGAAMVAVAYAGYSADHQPLQAMAPPLVSTVTATVTPASPTPPPNTAPVHPRSTGLGMAASAPKPSTASVRTQPRPDASAPSGPSPAPPQRSTPSCTGIAAVQVLNRCVLTVGGGR